MTSQGWTLRARAASGAPARLLLLVHGWTGDENSMWVFARNLAGGYWIVAPRAPYPTAPSGYSWRPRQPAVHERPSSEDLKPAVALLLSFVDAYAADNHLDASQFDAMGFSQGAALLSLLALQHPERIERLGVLAGFVPQGAEPLAERQPLKGKAFFVAHGTLDDLVPIDVARSSVQVFEKAGAKVTYCEDDVGHKLSVKCMRALQTYFA
ncbi:MAG: alpha/beta hydrolase [Anaerolineae bacterium]